MSCYIKKYLAAVAIFWHIQSLLLVLPANGVFGISRTTSETHVEKMQMDQPHEVPPSSPVANGLAGASNGVTKNPLTIIKESQSKFQRSAISPIEMYTSSALCEAFTFDDPAGHVFHSPGYPNTYPNNSDCVRILEAPAGFVLRLDFRDSFFIEPSDDCKFDFLEIRDGAHGFSTLLGHFCGNDFPPMIQSKDRFLWLHFHSDDNIEYSGFTIVYELIPRSTPSVIDEEGCRMVRDGFEGFINRTDVPYASVRAVVEHGVALDCMWTITVQEDWKIQLSFEKFKLDKPNECDSNFIEIFDIRTDIPSRAKIFCGSVAESVNSKANVVHIRFFAEASAINSSFAILYTAYHERVANTACSPGEFDCEDNKCISDTLYCNGIINCQYRWDEMKCSEIVTGQPEHITIIIVVFGLILGGMMVTFLINCIRKLMKDQKLIKEHIRQSRESELDAIDRREMKKSLQNLDKINRKTSLKSVEFHELGTYQRQESNKSKQSETEQPEERHYDEPPFKSDEIIINHQTHQIHPINETKMCETGVQTRESLFQNIYTVKTPTPPSIHPEPRLSSFGYPPPPPPPAVATVSTQVDEPSQSSKISNPTHHHHHHHRHQQNLSNTSHNNNNSSRDRYPIEKYPSTSYSYHENERKSAPDVIIVTNSISTLKR